MVRLFEARGTSPLEKHANMEMADKHTQATTASANQLVPLSLNTAAEAKEAAKRPLVSARVRTVSCCGCCCRCCHENGCPPSPERSNAHKKAVL